MSQFAQEQIDAPVKVIGKAGQILRAFSETGPELQLQQLSELTGLDISTVSRLANSMCAIGLLRYDSMERLYSPALTFVEFGAALVDRFSAHELVHRELRSVTSEFGWPTFLAIADSSTPGQVEYIEVVTTKPHYLNATQNRRPAHSTSSGRLLLAFGGVDFQAGTAGLTEAELAELESSLAGIRQDGMATITRTTHMGVAVPIANSRGEVIGTIGAEVPHEDFTAQRALVEWVLRSKAHGVSALVHIEASLAGAPTVIEQSGTLRTLLR